MLYPSFANAVCNSVTCDAVHSVVRPSISASFVSVSISRRDTCIIVARFALACWKSEMFLMAFPTVCVNKRIAPTMLQIVAEKRNHARWRELPPPPIDLTEPSIAALTFCSARAVFSASVRTFCSARACLAFASAVFAAAWAIFCSLM